MENYQPLDPYYRRWIEQGAHEHGKSLEEYLAWIAHWNPGKSLLTREREWVESKEQQARQLGITRAELEAMYERNRYFKIAPPFSPESGDTAEPPDTNSG